MRFNPDSDYVACRSCFNFLKLFQIPVIGLVESMANNDNVDAFKITSRVDSTVEPEPLVSHRLPAYQRDLDSPYSDHVSYEAVYAGAKKTLSVDCTQPDVICKFPLVVSGKNERSPIKQVNEVPIVKGAPTATETETKEEFTEDSQTEEKQNAKVPIFKGSLDAESLISDEKNIEETWILEKNIQNKKYKIPVKIVPSKVFPSYPVYHDFHDHFGGGDYHYPSNRHGSGWTPWMRAHPGVYNYPSQPCQPPVYHSPPPPCSPGLRPTKRPTINIDDKIDKEDD